MKQISYLLSIGAAIAALCASTSARADEPISSLAAKPGHNQVMNGPSAKAPNLLANRPAGNAKGWAVLQSLRTVSPKKDPNLLANRPLGNAAMWTHLQSLRTVPSTGPEVDLAHVRPLLSPKDPRYETIQREMAIKEFQIAPLK